MSNALAKITIGLCLCVVLLSGLTSPIFARTLDDIQREIDAQQAQLGQVNSEIATAQANLNNLQGALNSTQGEIPRLEAEIKQIEATITFNTLQMQQLGDSQKLKELEQEQREVKQDRALRQSYLDWRSDMTVSYYFSSGRAHPLKKSVYQSEVMTKENGGIEGLKVQIDGIIAQIGEFETETKSLEAQNADLAKRKAALEAQIIALRSSINSRSGEVAGLRAQSNVLQANISQLSAAQRELQNYEAWILGQSGNGGTNPLDTGEYYFTGRGREYYTGHGVGMSQYGAYGLANNGWSAQQILTHYYAGVSVVEYPATTEITIKYCQANPVYAAYQTNCMLNGVDNGPVITERVSFAEYLAGLGEMPNNWAIEARKAQMIAARTYALRYTNNGDPNIPICLTTYCQVSYLKNGYQGEMDAVTQTGNQVITHNGQLIEALYSADNNNGWGTADNDTVFSSFDGYGTAFPYLRAARDSDLPVGLYPNYNFNWTWRTNSYSLSDFDNLLSYAMVDPYLSSGSRSFVNNVRTAITNISEITLDRDASGRVKRVVLKGVNGVSRTMAGWFFKTIWNSWIDQVRPTGQADFIYSLTYYLLPT